jgi:thymidylate synthase
MSCDGLVGGAFNIAAYAAQTMMIAQCVDMAPGRFIHTFGDFHIYKNQILPNAQGDSVFTQLAREERPMPTLWINPEIKNIFDFKYEDFKLENYNPHPKIQYPVAV